jgi:DNA-3-methyladenine glycosylase
MWGPAGRAYIYLCYGLHHMLNLVTDQEGVGAAVLIRAGEPVEGLRKIRARRGGLSGPVLLTGPGKIARALLLDLRFNHHPVFEPGGLEIHDAPAPAELRVGPRVGIDYATPADRDAEWRFAAGDSGWVTVKKKLRSC